MKNIKIFIMGMLTILVIHCTATPQGREISSDQIRRMHLSPVSEGGRGWSQVGYADMIHLDGVVENLVPYNEDNKIDAWELTNGATGINGIARHVVYVGGVLKDAKTPFDTRTEAQKQALKDYIFKFLKNHPDKQIAGHYHFANKACPSFDVEKWLKEIGVPDKNIYRKPNVRV